MPRGRPPTGRKQTDKKITVYLEKDAIAALDRLVDQRIQRTGRKSITRSDLVREGVRLLLSRER